MSDLRSQQVLQDVLVLDGGRAVVLAVLLDLLVRVLLAEERHLARGSRTAYVCMYKHNVLSLHAT